MSFYNIERIQIRDNISAELDKAKGLLRLYGSGRVDSSSLFGAFPGYNFPEKLKRVEVCGENITICADCFYGFRALEAVFLCGVTRIENGAFFGCEALKRAELFSGLEEIGRGAFEGCASLRSICLPHTVSYMGESAFACCGSLLTAELSSALEKVPSRAFFLCGALECVRLPQGVKELAPQCFSGCFALKTVFLPATLQRTEGAGLFQNKSIEDIYYAGTKESLDAFIAPEMKSCGLSLTAAHIHCRAAAQSITKIVLTGGPCGGKTAALQRLKKYYTAEGYAVVIIPETATELISAGINAVTLGSVSEFQKSVIHNQLRKEEHVKDIISKLYSDKVLVICDRGAVDNMAYLAPHRQKEVLEYAGAEKSELLGRYDAVFQLLSTANGAPEFYTTANNSARSETPEDALMLDERITEEWSGHPYFRILDNSTDFDGKISRLITEINRFLAEKK